MDLRSYSCIFLVLCVSRPFEVIGDYDFLKISGAEYFHSYAAEDRFIGYLALVGRRVNITCNTVNDGDEIFRDSEEVVNTDRVHVISRGGWTNVTIDYVRLADAGEYSCSGKSRKLRVTAIGPDNPPKVLNYTIFNNNGRLLVMFNTEVKRTDTVNWYISYRYNSCLSQNCQRFTECEHLKIWPQEDGFHSLACHMNVSSSQLGTILYNVTGWNKFTRYMEVIESNLLVPPLAWDPQRFTKKHVTTTATPKTVETYRKFLPPAKRYQHTNSLDSHRSFYGYVAEKSENISFVCRPALSNDVIMFNTSNPNDKRITESNGNDWRNKSIVSVSFEDNGKYMCGQSIAWLAVIDTKKQADVQKHSCVDAGQMTILCNFYTNAVERDRFIWTITYSTSPAPGSKARGNKAAGSDTNIQRNCSHRSVRFAEELFKQDVQSCTIEGVEPGATYNFTLEAENPYNTYTLYRSVILDNSILTAKSPEVRLVTPTKESATLQIIYPDSTAELNYKVEGPLIPTEVRPNQSSDVQIELTSLAPFTTYKLSVSAQFTVTKTPSIWSDPVHVEFLTNESIPQVAPEVETTGYTFDNSIECSDSTRGVTIYWKAVPTGAGTSNGLITSYYIHALHKSHVLNYTEPLLEGSGDRTSASFCITSEETNLGVSAATAVGQGKALGVYTIPAASNVISLKPCKIDVEAWNDSRGNGELQAMWDRSDLPVGTFYTLYWCEHGMDGKCKDGTIQWKRIDAPETSVDIPVSSSSTYKFGVSAYTNNTEKTSGIIWANCVNYPEGELYPAELDIDVTGITAEVTVKEKCFPRSKAPTDDFIVQYSLLDSKGRLTGEVKDRIFSRCDLKQEITLDRYSHDYAFWVISESGTTTQTSKRKIVTTGSNAVWIITIVMSCVSAITAVVSFIAFFVWFCRQRKVAKSFKNPQLVRPSKLNEIDRENSSAEIINHYASLHFDVPDKAAKCDSLLQGNPFASEERMTKDDSMDRYKPPCSLSYRSVPSATQTGCGHSANSDLFSYRHLPNDYVKCTSVPDLDSLLLRMDVSQCNEINLSRLIHGSTPQKDPSSGFSRKMEYVKLDNICGKDGSDSESRFCDSANDDDGCCETDFSDLSSPDCSGGVTLSAY